VKCSRFKNLIFHDKPVPLSNQRNLGYKNVWVHCGNPDCRHSAVLDVEHLPDETTFNELMPRMLCRSAITAVSMSARPGMCRNERP
jgi:hypothetical protein